MMKAELSERENFTFQKKGQTQWFCQALLLIRYSFTVLYPVSVEFLISETCTIFAQYDAIVSLWALWFQVFRILQLHNYTNDVQQTEI